MYSTFATPIRSEWTTNGHVNIGGYMNIFDQATDALREHVGLGRAYSAAMNCGVYVVEVHATLSRELCVGDEVRVGTLVLGVGSKRLHLFHSMLLSDGSTAATNELLAVHVKRATGRAAPLPEHAFHLLSDMAEMHAALPLPAEICGRITLGKSRPAEA